MANSTNMVTDYLPYIKQKYSAELKCFDLYNSNPDIKIVNGRDIKIPHIGVSGFKNHNKNGEFNTGSYSNDYETKTLSHNRDLVIPVDQSDIDGTNLALSVGNLTATFEKEQVIPEKDSFTFSKLHYEMSTIKAGNINTTPLTVTNFLSEFDAWMSAMDDASVPEFGRILYCTSAIRSIIKEAEGIQRQISLSTMGNEINRAVHTLDDVKIIMVPKERFMTAYDFSEGCKPAVTAKQINCILIHPDSQISRDVYSYIGIFAPGSDSRALDNYIYANHQVFDTFVLSQRADGIIINTAA